MTHERDIERVLDHWLGEGPLVVGDHVIAQVAQRIEHQAQRPAWRLGQEGQLMTGALRMVAAVAAILFLAVASSVLLSRPSGPEPASPIPSPVTRSIYAANFDPGLSLQLPAGWVNTDDSYFSFELEGPSGAAAGAITLRTNPYLAANTADCSSATDVGTTEGIIAGLTADRRLVVSEPTPVTVGGVDGQMVDVELDASWTGTCPWSAGKPAVLLVARLSSPPGPDFGIAGLERVRLILLGRDAGVSIGIHAPAATFESFLRVAMPIVESFRFGAPRISPTREGP